ncbi:ASCH domain-containing protein [Pyrococcus yayanosii]|uniref:Hydrothetical protein n=1 Tax=Pyrococcus yayanosii (strain CH1 / JCM 16557) TaxID=529709 RepID=F8AG92_PYRYC|nr:ASCH domain-containing protein [Pyrococcus yayanosii]AEH23928.1 hydrothetical protein [Pyrococcus yayanosii CH1]
MKKVQIRKFILLDARYKEKILRGKKVTTIRYGAYEARPGSEIYIVITPSDTAIAKARIKAVRSKKVLELTNEDAKLDGFSDVKELVRELSKIYGELYGDDEVTIIEFEDVRPLKEGVPLKWLKGLNYKDPYEVVELSLENWEKLGLGRDAEIILRRISEVGLREAVKHFGPKRVQQALLKAYHALYGAGLI